MRQVYEQQTKELKLLPKPVHEMSPTELESHLEVLRGQRTASYKSPRKARAKAAAPKAPRIESNVADASDDISDL